MNLKNPHFGMRVLSRLAVLSLVTVGLVSVSAAPATALSSTQTPRASAWPNPAGNYVALGDSFTGGQGAPPYVPGPCLRSKYASYPTIASAISPYRLVANRACSGASIADVPAQLSGLSPSTKLVTITIGGIDAGSNEVLAACAPDLAAPICVETIQASTQRLAVVGPQLAGLYTTIAAAFPQARIVAMNYPLLFHPEILPLGDLYNASTALVNSTIQGAVAATGNPRISYTDVTQEFAGHGIGSRAPYIYFDPANPVAPPNFHPNALGNSFGYARALANDGVFRR
jgi:lysophospholipase L1-like esterase